MLTSEFDFDLPQELIAQEPLPQRDYSRMMVLERKSGKIVHARFIDFPSYISQGDVLVLNNTKVIPARVWGQVDGKEVEFLFLRESEKSFWETLCRPAKKACPGAEIIFSHHLKGKITDSGPEGMRRIQLFSEKPLQELKRIGFAPLPPYIKRKKTMSSSLRSMDLERYQTVYARNEGSIAAPTAGLHFTPEILRKIRKKGAEITEVTLDVGLATFQPVRAASVEKHRMLEESYFIGKKASSLINTAKRDSRPVVATGTTSVRTLESAYSNGEVRAGRRTTRLFIYPGFKFQVVDKLLTNFHLPKSSLLMLVSAFAGLDFIKKAYREAVDQRYRFFSYGDCMLIV